MHFTGRRGGWLVVPTWYYKLGSHIGPAQSGGKIKDIMNSPVHSLSPFEWVEAYTTGERVFSFQNFDYLQKIIENFYWSSSEV